jgi:IS30 family transposase
MQNTPSKRYHQIQSEERMTLARWPKCSSTHAAPSPVSSNARPKKGKASASTVGTLVDCTSRLLLLIKLPDIQTSGAANVLQGFTDNLLSISQALRQRMTDDQGREMARHKQLSQNTGIGVYFCDPHSPWQRGSNENMNALVRQ